MKLQNINYENMILIYHICRYIMLPLFTPYRKSDICFKYLRMLSRMKAAYIFFQYSFQEIRITNMYVIIQASVIMVFYPGPGFLSSATWLSLPKKHYNGLMINKLVICQFKYYLTTAVIV